MNTIELVKTIADLTSKPATLQSQLTILQLLKILKNDVLFAIEKTEKNIELFQSINSLAFQSAL